MSKEENFEDWLRSVWISEEEFSVFAKPFIEGTLRCCWNHQQAKLDKALQKIEQLSQIIEQKDRDLKVREHLSFDYLIKENKQLKEALKLAVEVIRDLIDKTEYGVNQWQAAWLPDEETASQKSIREARQFLESEQYKKVEGSL